MSTEDCSYSEMRNNRMKKSIEKITYCFVIIAALFVSFVSFVEPLVMKDINITKVILVMLCSSICRKPDTVPAIIGENTVLPDHSRDIRSGYCADIYCFSYATGSGSGSESYL